MFFGRRVPVNWNDSYSSLMTDGQTVVSLNCFSLSFRDGNNNGAAFLILNKLILSLHHLYIKKKTDVGLGYAIIWCY